MSIEATWRYWWRGGRRETNTKKRREEKKKLFYTFINCTTHLYEQAKPTRRQMRPAQIKSKKHSANNLMVKTEFWWNDRSIFSLPKIVFRCLKRDSVSFLLSCIFDVNFLISIWVFLINMMLTTISVNKVQCVSVSPCCRWTFTIFDNNH